MFQRIMNLTAACLTAACLITPVCTQADSEQTLLRLWTANTAAETGIINDLIEGFNQQYPHIIVKLSIAGAISVLDEGKAGNADLIITHHPPGEQLFVAEGYGLSRTKIMYNEFVILGPRGEQSKIPATIKDPLDLLRWISREELPFITPGQRSGTYRKLDQLWTLAGVEPNWVGYEISGVSSAAAIKDAALFDAYAFADLGTYLANREEVGDKLVPMFRDHTALRNYYSAIVVSNNYFHNTNVSGAQLFLDYLVSDQGQRRIAEFGSAKFGTHIYTPAAHLDEGLKAERAQRELDQKSLM
ncbi:MAG: LysR substrate-binding domain-containing protein, partial [Gammaproteobacteria bacterium]|nr:LysR substrate-binding domain-containing protein [Gammaproteobacteria bacterium]